MGITRKTKAIILNKYESRCAYCGTDIIMKTMQVDHIHPKALLGDNDIENLNPSCKFCNSYKGCNSLEVFRAQLLELLTVKNEHLLFRSNIKKMMGINFGSVKFVVNAWDGMFYFEKYEKRKKYC